MNHNIHLLIRYSDSLHSVGNTMERHLDIVQKHGSVWMGKFGKTLGWPKIKILTSQISGGKPTYVYMVQRKIKSYILYKGSITNISREYPENEQQLIPPYYEEMEITPHIHLWLKLVSLEERPKDELNAISIVTSNRSAMSAITTSMAGLFIVKDGPGYDFSF